MRGVARVGAGIRIKGAMLGGRATESTRTHMETGRQCPVDGFVLLIEPSFMSQMAW